MAKKWTKQKILNKAKLTINRQFSELSGSTRDKMYNHIEQRVASGSIHDYNRFATQLDKGKKLVKKGDNKGKKLLTKSISGRWTWNEAKQFFDVNGDNKKLNDMMFGEYEDYYYDEDVNDSIHDYNDLNSQVKNPNFAKLPDRVQKALKDELKEKGEALEDIINHKGYNKI